MKKLISEIFLKRSAERTYGKNSIFLSGISVILALIACFGFVGAAVALTSGQPQQSDIFANYEAIMPGQPSEALAEYSCQFPTVLHDVPFTITQCGITPSEELFQAITVLHGNGKIQDIVFDVSGALQTGDLAQQWGRPDTIERQDKSFVLRWESGASARVQIDRTFDYHLPVQFVWFSSQQSQ